MSTPPIAATAVSIVIVDDSEVVRAGLTALLSSSPQIKILSEAGDVAGGVATVLHHKPDVVLLDIRLPDGTGFDACRTICRANIDTRVLILTSVADEEMVDNAIRAGAHGYLLKEINGTALVQSIVDIAAGKSILDPAITARVLSLVRSNTPTTRNLIDGLSPQESRVLALIAEGQTNKEVAQAMNLAEKTVKNYLSTVFEKLHVTRRTQAAALYVQSQSSKPI
ncbi:response regulator [Synoicihabitans lomoniglobus]|uniref:Response regulator transcription factor n=1 Tax=Synoicihabitans lomoniglobus TaxID=2909285 RepID=A0AAF0I513_9BACT|nr:response regulator transcription factor [Opitutaceae bacterium LMO-M01]WED67064.1 response regulator transcription factor [Opitutaceae bacterium LMO-M01]